VAQACQLINYLSIDVEDYFHVSAFEKFSSPDSWDKHALRVEYNTEKILALLAERRVKATFFVLGWVAKRCPKLIKKIVAEHHEVASHGYNHQRVNRINRKDFREDIRASKAILEDISGQEVMGYRAPSFSISSATQWAFDELFEAGYRYDSSIFPIRHDFYGISDWPRFAGWAVKNGSGEWEPEGASCSAGRRLFELPITTLHLGNTRLPIGGGGYFRFYPYAFTRWGLRRINRQEGRPFVFYLHPWELDPEQPRMTGIGLKSKFRHYINLNKTETRFSQLLDDFDFAPLCHNLIKNAHG
jgi:polysaccharide deacetylase family protein (PEP-CTERM system associated)